MKQYKGAIGMMMILVMLVLLAGFALASSSPFDPQPGFGCVPEMQATLVSYSRTQVPSQPGIQKWTLLDETQENTEDGWRMACNYAFSVVIGDPQPTSTP